MNDSKLGETRTDFSFPTLQNGWLNLGVVIKHIFKCGLINRRDLIRGGVRNEPPYRGDDLKNSARQTDVHHK